MAEITIREGLDGAIVPDSYMDSDNPTANHGTDTDLWIGYNSISTAKFRSVSLWDVSVIPAGVAINSAKLTLNAITAALSAQAAKAHRVTAPWSEAAVTWNKTFLGTNWTTPGGDYSDTGAVDWTLPTSTGDFDITGLKDLVEDAIANHGSLLNLLLKRKTEATSLGFIKVASGEHATPGSRQRLIVDYTPAAGSVFAREGIHPAVFGGRILR